MKTTIARTLFGTGALLALRRRRQISSVHPELRTRALYLPLVVGGPGTLAVARRLFAGASPSRPEVTTEAVTAPVDVLVHRSPGHEGVRGVLLWIHGGGLVLGSPERENAWCTQVAAELGVIVVAVRYRLAPENPYPAALDDCVAALEWLHDHADDLGVDRSLIAVGGASAGGGLAAAVCQRAHDEGRVPVVFQLLVYPMLDDRTTLRRDRDIRTVFGWTPRSNRFAWSSYLGSRLGAVEARAYAVPARRTELTGLPDAWIGVGDLDLFRDEDVTYAQRLRSAGVPCELYVVPGMYHGADVALGDRSPLMYDFRQRMLTALEAAIGVSARPAKAHQ